MIDLNRTSAAATVRDRDKVRDEVLRGLGWSLARIWSADWWRNPAGSLDRLDAILRERPEQSRGEAAPGVETARELDVQAVAPGGDYRCTSFADMAAQIAEARYPATVDDIRGLEDVPLPELCACLRSCEAEDRPGDAARRFGLRRLSAAGRERLRLAAPTRGHLG